MRLRAPRSAVVLALIAGALTTLAQPGASAAPDPRPNIVVVMTDDQRFDSLGNCMPSYGAHDGPTSIECMPNVRSLLMDHGVTFEQSYVSTSVCCPSRASFMTGLYAHNHDVLTNEKPDGGFEGFQPREASTVATWLHDAGYRTALIGKYLNGYYGPQTPPGWDDWHAMFGSASDSYQNFKLVENGVVNSYSRSYHTTVTGQKAVQFVNSTPNDQPLFLYFTPHAPHLPFTPAKGDGHDYEGMAPWRPPSYNEADVSDKSAFWQGQAIPSADYLAKRDIDQYRQLETLKEVDRQIGNIVTALGPRLSNTLFVFTSDNGLTWGEHRDFEQKGCEFEECMRVPLVVRYDPLTGGAPSDDTVHPVQNIDLAPTIVAAAGVTTAHGMDGRSILPLLSGTPPSDWRTAILGENFGSLSPITQKWPPTNAFVETFQGDPDGAGFKYVEACNRDAAVVPCQVTATSFYNESTDPYEMCNRLSPAACGQPPPAGVVPDLLARLHALQQAEPPVIDVDEPAPTSLSPITITFGGTGLSFFQCSVDGGALIACASPFTPPDQTNGEHVLRVLANGPGGTAAPATERWWISSRFPATPSFTSTPTSPSALDVDFAFTDTEAGVTFLCALDGADRTPCTSPQPLDGLSIGDHAFSVFALDAANNLSFPATHTWHVQDDVTPPTLAMKKPAADELLRTRKVVAQWSGSDDNSGLARYDVTQRDGLSGSPVLVQSDMNTSRTIATAASGTYCFQVTAVDREANTKTGQERCAAVPVDDGALTFSGPVTQEALTAGFDGTITRMTAAGSTTATFTGRRVGVLLRKGPDLGKASITVDGGAPKTVDLYAGSSKFLWWTQAYASSGPHSVSIAWTGTKNSSSAGWDVVVDGIAAISDAPPQPL
jgi:arylsulfatase A-like enzyme